MEQETEQALYEAAGAILTTSNELVNKVEYLKDELAKITAMLPRLLAARGVAQNYIKEVEARRRAEAEAAKPRIDMSTYQPY